MKSLLLIPALLLVASSGLPELRFPGPPVHGQHVIDPANLITSEDEARIQEIAQKLLSQERVQLVVVAIDSMAEYSRVRMTLEDYADRLFQHGGIGASQAASPEESRGILLLLSRRDRGARIELGPGWGYSKDSDCLDIMENHLVPAFKKGQYSSGLVAGAAELDRVARGLKPESALLSMKQLDQLVLHLDRLVLFGGSGGLVLFTLISLIRRGSRGWAWLFWNSFFSLLWTLVRIMSAPSKTSGHHSDSFHDSSHRYSGSHRDDSYSSGSSSRSDMSSGSSSWSGGSSSSSHGGGATGSW